MKLVDMMDAFARVGAAFLECDRVFINVTSGSLMKSLGAFAFQGDVLRSHISSHTLCAHTVSQNSVLAINDASEDEIYAEIAYVNAKLISGYLGAPIHSATFGLIGSLSAISRTPKTWREDQKGFVENLAKCVGIAFDAEFARSDIQPLLDTVSLQDRIIVFLSSQIDGLVSVYSDTKELLYASKPLYDALGYDCVSQALKGAVLNQKILVNCDGQSIAVDVERLDSGLIVCKWGKSSALPLKRYH